MAIVTYALSAFDIQPFPDSQPRLKFVPSGNAINGTRLFATKPIYSTPAGSGAGSVNLAPTDSVRPAIWYQIEIEWLDSEGNCRMVDHVPWQIFVPNAGGNLDDLIKVPANPMLFYAGPTLPPQYNVPGAYWWDTTTDDIWKVV